MLFYLLIVSVIYGASFMCAPFPVWTTYFSLWKSVIRGNRHATPKIRMAQAWFLTRYALLTPVWTLFWCIDEVLYSDYRSTKLDEVVVILGQPRSGTTFFHRTLACDEDNFLVAKHMEWRFPYICVQKFLRWSGLYNRIANISYWSKTRDGEMASKMHAHILGDYEEDGMFFEERFLNHYFLYRRFPYPDLMEDTDCFDRLSEKQISKIIRIHKKVLQKISFLRGKPGQVPLLKENETMCIMSKFPHFYDDVKFIALVRDPEQSLRSYHVLSVQSTLAKTGINPEVIDGWYEANMHKRRREFELQEEFLSKLGGSEQQVRLPFEAFTTETVDAFHYLYHRLGLKISPSFHEVLEDCERKQIKRKREYTLPDIPALDLKTVGRFKKIVDQAETRPSLVRRSGKSASSGR